MFNVIICLSMLSYPSSITSESEWTSPEVRIVEEWSLNVLDRIEPSSRYLGYVFGVETDDSFSWHTVLLGNECVLHFD